MDKADKAIIVIAFLYGFSLANSAANRAYPGCAPKVYFTFCPQSERNGFLFGYWLGEFVLIAIILYAIKIVVKSLNKR